MSEFIHTVTYQGYPVQEMRFARRPGLLPDYGYIDVDIADFKRLEIKNPDAIPWNGRQGHGANIETWSLKEGRRTIPLDFVPPPAPTPGIGFFPSGDLVLETFEVIGAARITVDKITYADVYIAPGGMEEITEDLDEVKSHNRGVWRIPITDVRVWWQYGILAEKINAKLDGGQFWKPSTDRGRPWSAAEVFAFLFSQLPGAPAVSPGGDLSGLTPPENVVGDMTPVREVLQALLDRYGLQATLLPYPQVAVYRRNSTTTNRGDYFVRPGRVASVDAHPAEVVYEKKSITLSDRPPLVTVTGKRRIRSITMAYVPIYQDQDDRFYRLDSIPKRWNLRLEDIRKGAMIGHEKAFRYMTDRVLKSVFDPLDPARFDRGTGTVFAERLRILQKWAFKGYGPSVVFRDAGDRGLTRKEFQMLPFLPVQDYGEKSGPGANEFRVRPPLVRAYTFKQAFFEGRERFGVSGGKLKPGRIPAFQELDKAIAVHISRIAADRSELKDVRDQMLAAAQDKVKALNSFAQKVGASLERDLKSGTVVRIGTDLVTPNYFGRQEIFVRPEDVAAANRAYDDLKSALTALNVGEEQLTRARAIEEGIRKQLTRVYLKLGGIAGWLNQPYGRIEDGAYTIDRETGIILFSEAVGIMEDPFTIDKENTTLATDGKVTVRYGYEINSNSAFDWSSFTFGPAAGGGVTLVRGCSPVTVQTAVEHDPDLRLYEDAAGTPLNAAQCVDQAAPRARAVTEPRVSIGYVYHLGAFVDAVPIAGEVHHQFDGDKAETFITVNAPNARLPQGSVNLKGDTVPATLRVRELAP